MGKLRVCLSTFSSIILTTHDTNEHSIALAIESLGNLSGMLDKPILLRMFDPNNHNEIK